MSGFEILATVAPMAIVFGLLGLCLVALRRFRLDKRPSAEIVIVDRLALDSKSSLVLIDVCGKRLLIANSHEGMNTLETWDQRESAHAASRG